MDPPLIPNADQLRDIHVFDGVPWWPPGPGWWWLAATAILGFLVLRWLMRRRVLMSQRWSWRGLTIGDWRRAAARALSDLRRRAPGQPAKDTAGELSELLRRIAMARLGRAACAGLTGHRWLLWLAANDPRGFDWTHHGTVLLEAPYAPPEAELEATTRTILTTLIDATEAWLGAPARGGSDRSGGRETADV
ncbi:DUF4381 domain-containing protein [Thioalkalicoccus limnaeus]|uniref:DUF4381 domain-containing protein n=1 Tax=Thioalkalicoccus limnaeus TaxID=120681 RepID=A0ABV4BBB9_9GAMM